MTTADSTTGRRRTPSSDIRRELLGAAEAVLVRDGPGGVTVRAVAAEAGIAPMGVYNRFGGKDGLVDALLIKGFDALRAAVASRGEPGMLDRLRGSGERYREFALASRHFYAIMFEGAIPHNTISDEATGHAQAAFGALVSIVETAALAGAIVAPEPAETAQQIWSTVHGAVTLELQGLVQTPDPAQTYRDTIELLLRGLQPPPGSPES